MSDLLFDTPWWILVLCIGGGGCLWFLGNSRLDAKLKTAGTVVVLLGVLLALLSYLVDTDKEKVTKQTKQIVASVNDRDWKTFESLLDPKTSFEGGYNDRAQIVEGAKKTADVIGLKSVTILSMDVRQTDTIITVDLNALSDQDTTMGRPMSTSWRFDWQDTGTGWKLTRIEPLQGAEVNKNDILQHLVKP